MPVIDLGRALDGWPAIVGAPLVALFRPKLLQLLDEADDSAPRTISYGLPIGSKLDQASRDAVRAAVLAAQAPIALVSWQTLLARTVVVYNAALEAGGIATSALADLAIDLATARDLPGNAAAAAEAGAEAAAEAAAALGRGATTAVWYLAAAAGALLVIAVLLRRS